MHTQDNTLTRTILNALVQQLPDELPRRAELCQWIEDMTTLPAECSPFNLEFYMILYPFFQHVLNCIVPVNYRDFIPPFVPSPRDELKQIPYQLHGAGIPSCLLWYTGDGLFVWNNGTVQNVQIVNLPFWCAQEVQHYISKCVNVARTNGRLTASALPTGCPQGILCGPMMTQRGYTCLAFAWRITTNGVARRVECWISGTRVAV